MYDCRAAPGDRSPSWPPWLWAGPFCLKCSEAVGHRQATVKQKTTTKPLNIGSTALMLECEGGHVLLPEPAFCFTRIWAKPALCTSNWFWGRNFATVLAFGDAGSDPKMTSQPSSPKCRKGCMSKIAWCLSKTNEISTLVHKTANLCNGKYAPV